MHNLMVISNGIASAHDQYGLRVGLYCNYCYVGWS